MKYQLFPSLIVVCITIPRSRNLQSFTYEACFGLISMFFLKIPKVGIKMYLHCFHCLYAIVFN